MDIPLGVGGAFHSIYMKQHFDKSQSKNDSTTLFIGNIDYGTQLDYDRMNRFLRNIFSGFGNIESISVSDYDENENKQSSRFAHVKFEKKAALKGALSADDEMYAKIFNEVASVYGLGQECRKRSGKCIIQDNFMYDTDIRLLKEDADQYMVEFDSNEQDALAERNKRTREEDEDGFILVNSKRKKQKKVLNKRGGTGEGRLRKKKKSYELKNFYRFQMREEKREKLAELRKKFSEDKSRVAKMKEARKFKPF